MRSRLGALGLVIAWLSMGSAAHAAANPAAACQGAQLRAAARLLADQLGCFADYYRDPAADPGAATVLPACRTEAEEDFAPTYEEAIDEAGAAVCALETPAETLLADLAAEVDALDAGISGGFADASAAERTLHAALHNATGAALSGALGVEAKNAKKPDAAKRLAGRDKARAKLLSSFEKAFAKAAGVSYSGLSADAVAAEVDRIADELAAASTPASFSLGGTVLAAAGSTPDGDVNDPNADLDDNDTPETAQPVAVPAAIGGYVNTAGAGPSGSSQLFGDLNDYYRVSLAAGQHVNLRFADPAAADVDLCLFDLDQNVVACSLGVSETEEVIAPSDGEYFVSVFPFFACACGSSYVLTIGQALADASATGWPLDADFVPGELIVTLAPKAAGLADGPPAAAKAYEQSLALEALAGASDREMLFRLPAAGAARAAAAAALGLDRAREARFSRLSPARRERLDTLHAAKALRLRTDVASAEPNFLRHAQATPNDSFFGLQWHYPQINLPAAWDLTTGSDAVEVAVIDTGALFGHPDLAGALSTAFDFDFVSDRARSVDGNGIDDDASDPGDGGGIQPSSFHGSHVAGTVGASTNNGSGVAGVAWDVTLIPLRALGLFGSGTSYDILQAVRYAAGLPNDSGTSHLVDVINLSLGGGGSSQSEQNVYTQARNAGVIIVAAAGNNNSSQLFYPASYDGVVSVSAVDLRGQKAPYSNFGDAVDVAAPGGDTSVDRNGDGYADGVLSTIRDEDSGTFVYAFYQGTSMAAPHVAGVAALMRAVSPTLTPPHFDALLAAGDLTTDLGSPGRDDLFGHGLVDARAAVEAAQGTTSDDPILLVSPTSLNFGTTLTSTSFAVSNGGGGSLTVSSVSEVVDEPWLSVTPSSGLGSYQVSIDRTGLAEGTYSAQIAIASSAGSATVSVVMAVQSGASAADAGFHYVLLIDPDSFETVAQVDVEATAGLYTFAFPPFPSGAYLLYAGSDTDNDFFICGTGEACGAYPTLGTPEPILLTGDRNDLDFVSGFLQTLGNGTTSAAPSPKPAPRRLRLRSPAR